MNTQTISQFEPLDTELLATVEGGKNEWACICQLLHQELRELFMALLQLVLLWLEWQQEYIVSLGETYEKLYKFVRRRTFCC